MNHRNSDNNGSWNSRISRNNNNNNKNDGADGNGRGGGGGSNFKDRNWGGNNRYSSDNRYNNKERRNYRGYAGGRKNNFDGGRPYRNNVWINNVGQDNTYTRYQNNWNQKTSGNIKHADGEVIQQPIPSLMQNFNVEGTDEQRKQREDLFYSTTSRSAMEKEKDSSNKSWANDDFGSSGDGFQGFADVELSKEPNDEIKNDCVDLVAKDCIEQNKKSDMCLQENELSKLIVDEAMKIISDAEQPSCSSASQSNSTDAQAAISNANNPNPERRASIERSAEQVTRKLINQLTSMNKHSLKQVINNPDSKYETALKTHARQKLRAEVRRQLRNFNLNENATQPKTACNMLEPDESVDSDKIPDALLEQIGKVLDLNLLDLNVTEQVTTSTVGDEEAGVANSSDPDFTATEVLDKNLRLTDEDDQFDTDDLFARAELLLMQGSESVRQGNSSGPSSPTDEMFPNEQIDSIVSEDNGIDLNESDSEQIERMLDEPLHAAFPCFLRVSTVEELNKKVDNIPVLLKESEICDVETAIPLLPLSEIVNDSLNTNQTEDNAEAPLVSVLPSIQPPSLTNNQDDSVCLIEDNSVPVHDQTGLLKSGRIPDVETSVAHESIEDLTQSPSKNMNSEASTETIRAPTHPELAARKSKGSKTYKPNLVLHEHLKRDSSGKESTTPEHVSIPSTTNLCSLSNSKIPSKSSSATNLNIVSKPTTKYQNNRFSSNNTDSSTSSTPRGRSRGKRNTVSSSGGHNNSKENTMQSNGTSPNSDNHNKHNMNESHRIVTPTVSGNVSIPQSQPPVNQQVVQRSIRSKTPGPALAGGPLDNSSSLGVKKKKKKKRNRWKDRSPPPDSGMMLECDLRISRPIVTPTNSPLPTRDTTQIKKNGDSAIKPTREMRAKSADPKFNYDSKKDRDRNKDRGRNRDDDKKHKGKGDDKKDQEKEDKREKDVRKEKESDTSSICTTNALDVCKSALAVSKPDHRTDVKKSPISKPAAKPSVDHSKISKENRDDCKEMPKESLKESEKEHSKEEVKELNTNLAEEIKLKDKVLTDTLNVKEESEAIVSKQDKVGPPKEEKDSADVTPTPNGSTKPSKKKKSLLRGPNLIKGKREAIEEPKTNLPSPQKENEVVEIVDVSTSSSETSDNISASALSLTRGKEVTTVTPSKSSPMPVGPTEQHTLISTASIIQRTASPRPWKSPGEKKLIPPSVVNIITHPMSPPPVERVRKTPTPPSPAMSPEPPQRMQQVASPIRLPQSEVLTGRISLQTTLAPIQTVVPQVTSFTPIMALLNQMQDIDSKMSEFQRRKMQIDSEMMRLNSEKFQIDQNSMQLQNERFMLLNSLRAALVECELSTLASVQSVSRISAAAVSPVLNQRRRNHEPESDALPKSKRRKQTLDDDDRHVSTVVSSLSTDLSESEDPPTPSSAAGGERTIRRITKISENTEILKLFQRRRLISDRSAEESQSEDSGSPQVISTPASGTATKAIDRPVPAKRRRTRTYGGGVGGAFGSGNEPCEPSIIGARLRSDSTKSVEAVKPIEQVDQSTKVESDSTLITARLKKDEEIPLVVAHRQLLPRQVKVVLNKLNVVAKRGGDGT